MSNPDFPPIHTKMVSALPPIEVPAGLYSPGMLTPALHWGRGALKASQHQPGFPQTGEGKEV